MMLHIDKDDIRRAAGQLDALYTALKCFIYYTEIKNRHNTEKQSSNCWDFIEFTLLYSMLINWNEVFGINTKSDHWKEITFEQDEYTDTLYAAGGYTYASWYEFRRSINDLKNNFISFPDPYHYKNQDYDLEGIRTSLVVTHDWLYSLIANNEDILSKEESDKWPIMNKNLIEELKNEIQVALDNA